MKRESVMIIRCYNKEGKPSVWHEHFTWQSIEQNVPWMLGMVDAALGRAFEHAPPDIVNVNVSFLFPDAIPRPILAKAFYDAALELAQVVSILPEDRRALEANPFTFKNEEVIDDRTGPEANGPESTGQRRTGRGVNRGKA